DSGCGTGGSAGSSADICFTEAYLTNSFDVGRQSVWQYQMNNFWAPVISAVDSYPSTAGYEFANEPYNYYTNYGVTNTDLGQIAAYNAYFSNQIRSLTNNAIVVNLDPWMYPNFDTNYGGNTLIPPSGDCTTPGSCVIDIHWYMLSETGESTVSGMDTYLSANAAEASSLGMPIFVGEFAPCDADCTLTTSSAQTAINDQVTAAQTSGMGQAYFAWSCNQNSDPNDWIDMLGGSTCSTPNTVATLVANAYTSIMETTTTTTG
ncbi:MAG TPA: cellulase family glycosylhydrolase, partial [Nitrososphaerales archaeon]|nr:cellulase family glycosylhydrolase [Nitrososphaerales archaeon]